MVRAAVLGSPVRHSLSPALHAAAYAELGLTWWHYKAIECDEAGLPALLDRCGPDWAGLSLTMPLKRTVLPLLDRIDPLVADVGCANTVLFAAAQRLGHNTDVAGIARALAEHGVGNGARAPGGAPLASGGGEPAQARPVGPALILGSGGKATSLAGARLIISTVPKGAADFAARALARLHPVPEVVFDVVYHPWPTALARAAEQAGAVVVNGFDLLLHQAALQVELMTGRPAPVEAMRRAGHAELARRAAQ